MSALVHRIEPARLLFWPGASIGLLLVLCGAGAAAIAPMAGIVALALLLAARMQVTATVLLAAALIVDNPGERPMDGQWRSPLYHAGTFLYENMHKFTGIEALRFSALEVLAGICVVIILLRKHQGDPIDDPLGLAALPNPMKKAFAVFLPAILFLELYGLARGGDFKNSLWQLRQLFWLPVLGMVFGHAFKSSDARLALLRTLLAAAWVRCLFGIYFSFAIARPQGLQVEYAMTHSDSILTVVAILIGLGIMVERPTSAHLSLNLALQPVLLLGLVVNDRRIAYVTLGAGLLTMVMMGPASLKRAIKRGAILLLPLAALYVGIGWHSSSPIFGPVATVRDMSTSADASSQTRDIENYNLLQTLKRRPILGSGFGHEYEEVVRANRVDQVFAQYRFIAHNSVLWLLSLSGWFGFTLVWMVFPIAILVAVRAHQGSASAVDRVLAFATIAAVTCYVVQAWGDMGLQSWMGTLVIASLTGASGAMFTAHQPTGVHAC